MEQYVTAKNTYLEQFVPPAATYEALSDTHLIKSICTGDQKAFEVLVRRYSPSIFNYLYHLTRNTEVAEDISQDVFLRIYTALPRIDAERPFKPWLFQVAHNCFIDDFRRRRRQAVSFSSLSSRTEEEEEPMINFIADTRSLPQEQAEQHELQELLCSIISLLPPKYRVVTTLRYTSQLGFAEIGTILKMPEGTAKTFFARSKKLLRKIIEEQYPETLLAI